MVWEPGASCVTVAILGRCGENGGVPSRRRGLTIGLLTVVTAIAFESMAVLTAMPSAAAELGHQEWYAWAFTAFVIAQIMAITLTGRLCDSGGPARPLVFGLAVSVIGALAAALAPSMAILLVARFVQGFGGGMTNVALMVVAAQAYSMRERAVIMTWFSAAWIMPSFVGPVIAAWLTTTWSWHWVFWSVIPFMVAGAALMAPSLSQLPKGSSGDVSSSTVVPAGVGIAIGVALLQWAGQSITAWTPWQAAAGVVLIGIFGRWLLPTGKSLLAVTAVRGLTAGSFFGVQAFLPLMLVQQRGLELLWAGASITIASCGWMLGSWLQAQAWLRLRRDRMIVLGTLLVSGGLALVSLGAWFISWPVFVPIFGVTIAGVGMGFQQANTSLATMQLSRAEELGHNTSALQVGEALGGAMLAGLAGSLFAQWHGTGDLTVMFAAPSSAMLATSLVAIAAAFHIGMVENHSIV